ncbi:6-phosphofructo-2-kinase/fructose-2,6-bisphosphatase [Selaginella moellendorffii]|nr:6-phosphofructo-2-kinase/fructose-2,6-bisphosphatase [Selaginella moellendorffii]|eukprot:XP_002987173.2 6-phosphofructo-2-kinase/fructose-2,6-bisphosphatase [Selaginella moellendorffii]
MFFVKNEESVLRVDGSHQLLENTRLCSGFYSPGSPIQIHISITLDQVSPFALGKNWRHSQSRGFAPEVCSFRIEELKVLFSQESDVDGYEVPSPNSETQYAADAAEVPRDREIELSASVPVKLFQQNLKDRCVSIKDFVVLGSERENACVPPETSDKNENRPDSRPGSPIALSPQEQQLDRSVSSSPGLVRLGSDVSVLNGSIDDLESKVMPSAAGAGAAGAVADRLLGPKERRRLAIVLVGLPARGKTFTAAKLTRYLRWLGHDTKHFNVGKYRRLKHGCTQNADFFRSDNQEGIDARNEVAALAMDDMLSWMDEGGQVGVFDATNSTKLRRKMLLTMAEGKCQVIFLETICKDPAVIDQNIRLKIRKSPDYADQPDYEAALADFKARLVHYSKAYEPVDEGSYIKMIDMVSEQDGQMQVNNISGYLPGRIVFFLVNTHLTPRPILLTRHGESMFNLNGRIGGDPELSATGDIYATKLASFVHKRLKSQHSASIWTSTLRRTILTATHITGFPKVQWRALDEIDAGICDGMTYEEIKETMPDEYQSRKLDKLRYRYPRGESYLDVIQRLEPVIVELERQRSPVVVVAHQAILRSLYAYFTDKPLDEIPHIEMPLHTIIEIQMGVAGVQEKRYKLL